MKKIIMSLAVIAAVGAVVIGGTTAYFSDTESSSGNTFTAGAIDLLVDSQAHYAGMSCVYADNIYVEQDIKDVGYYWVLEDPNGEVLRPDMLGESCYGTWGQISGGSLTDGLNIVNEKFFNYGDLKPGDEGENTISMHVINNDAYMCVSIVNMVNDENGMTEPEEDVDVTDGVGDLGAELNFFAWADDGDNIYNNDETPLFAAPHYGPADDVLAGKVYPLYTHETGAIAGGDTSYLGLYWCYGDISISENGLSCDGSTVGNESQTDILTADISFYVEQARNNEGFVCPGIEDNQAQKVGAAMADYKAPAECTLIVDDDGTADYTTIQNAIGAANTEAVICVADGKYDEFVVNKAVTIAGLTNPNSNTGGARVTPSSASVQELAYVTSSNVTISGLNFDGAEAMSTGGQLAGIQISPNGGDINNVNITYNIIQNLIISTPGAANKGVQWFTEGGTGYILTNSTIANNLINRITAHGNGGYGIQTVGAMSNVDIEYNTIMNISGSWDAGIAFDTKDSFLTPMASIAVNNNQIENEAVQVEFSIDSTGIAVNYNNLAYLAHGGSNTDIGTEGIVNAQNNWWGDLSPSDNVSGAVDYDPFSASAYALN